MARHKYVPFHRWRTSIQEISTNADILQRVLFAGRIRNNYFLSRNYIHVYLSSSVTRHSGVKRWEEVHLPQRQSARRCQLKSIPHSCTKSIWKTLPIGKWPCRSLKVLGIVAIRLAICHFLLAVCSQNASCIISEILGLPHLHRKHRQSYRHADPRRQQKHTAVTRITSNRATMVVFVTVWPWPFDLWVNACRANAIQYTCIQS